MRKHYKRGLAGALCAATFFALLFIVRGTDLDTMSETSAALLGVGMAALGLGGIALLISGTDSSC